MYTTAEKIFQFRAKDELGQYLDDEQVWRAGTDYTSPMEARLAEAIRRASDYVDGVLRGYVSVPVSAPNEFFVDLVTELAIGFIFKRRDFADSEAKAIFERVDAKLEQIKSGKIKIAEEGYKGFVAISGDKDVSDEQWQKGWMA